MKKVLAVVMILGALALVGWWGATILGSQPVGAVRPDGSSMPMTAAMAAKVQDTAGASVAERSEIDVAAASRVVIRGRCVDATTGAPLPGCLAVLRSGLVPGWRPSPMALLDRPPLASANSAADGAFEVACPFDTPCRYLLGIEREDRAGLRQTFGPWTSGRELDLGDVPLHEGVMVRGRVVDRHGRAVVGVNFSMAFPTAQYWTVLPDVPVVILVSGQGGEFATESALKPGDWQVSWLASMLPAERARDVLRVRLQPGPFVQDLVFPIEDAAQTIHGRALDPDGRPVPRLMLEALGGGTFGRAITEKDGTFAIYRVEPFDVAARGPVALTLADMPSGYELTTPISCAWGDAEVRCVVRPARQVVVRPVDAETRKVVPHCEVLLAALHEDERGERCDMVANPSSEVLPDGSIRFALSAQRYVLQVVPRDAAHVTTPLVHCDATSTADVVIPVPLAAGLQVRVLTTAGNPIADSEVFTLRAAEVTADQPLPEPTYLGVEPLDWWYRTGASLQPIDRGRTNAEGRVQLRASNGPIVLAALGPGHVPKLCVVDGGCQVTDIVVDAGGSLRCEFTPTALVQRFGTSAAYRQFMRESSPDKRDRDRYARGDPEGLVLRVARAEGEQGSEPAHNVVEVPVNKDGSCQCAGLPEGAYTLCLNGNVIRGATQGALLWLPLGTVSVRAGKETIYRRDLGALQMGRMRGQVFVNGQPWALQTGSLEARYSDGTMDTFVSTDAEGRFDCECLAGGYRLHLQYHHAASPGTIPGYAFVNEGYWYAEEEVVVHPGQTVDAVYSVRRITARARILTDDGAPAAGLSVTMETEGLPRGFDAWITDGGGWIEIDHAPMKPFALIVQSPNAAQGLAARLPGAARDATLGTFHVPASGDTAEFEARLPEGWR